MAERVKFIGSASTIKVDSGVVNLDVARDLYSAAKEDWINEVDDVHKFSFPFSVVGGDDIGGGQRSPSYFFLNAPWVLESPGDGQELSVSTNLYGRSADGGQRDPFRLVPGDILSNNNSDIPGLDSISGADPILIARAVIERMQAVNLIEPIVADEEDQRLTASALSLTLADTESIKNTSSGIESTLSEVRTTALETRANTKEILTGPANPN